MKISILLEEKKVLMSFLFALKMIYWVEPDILEGVIAINIHVTKTLMFEQLHVKSALPLIFQYQ